MVQEWLERCRLQPGASGVRGAPAGGGLMDTFHCAVCGHRGPPNVEENAGIGSNYRCQNCRSMQRQRDIAQLIVDEFGRGLALSLTQLVNDGYLDEKDVYEVGMVGPFYPRLKRLKRYTRSYLWDDVPLGEVKDGVRCEDLRRLTFPEASFDLIISAEVLEHVFEIERVLPEIRRVLKPNGVHVFSIPNRYPFPAKTTARARLDAQGQIEYLDSPAYHVAGDGSRSLVVSEFGADLCDMHDAAGLRLSIVRRQSPFLPFQKHATFVARRAL
jgi:SAM-dependent methyltransferase